MTRTRPPFWTGLTPVLLLTLLLGGCGFHLRGYEAVPEHLKRLYLQAHDGATGSSLRQLLQANGIVLVEDPADAPYRLLILSETHERKAATLNTQAKTEEYELRSQLQFEIRDADDQVVVPAVNLLVERVYSFDENNIVAKDAEEALLRREMRDDLARQVVRRYLSLGRS